MAKHVQIKTSLGDIRIELDDVAAPESTRNFLSLIHISEPTRPY